MSFLSPYRDDALFDCADDQSGAYRFRDIASQAGLTTIPHSSPERHYLVEMKDGWSILNDG